MKIKSLITPKGQENSCGSPVVILEKAAEALSALD
jgi:hypothetical protein